MVKTVRIFITCAGASPRPRRGAALRAGVSGIVCLICDSANDTRVEGIREYLKSEGWRILNAVRGRRVAGMGAGYGDKGERVGRVVEWYRENKSSRYFTL